jgi:hypothetical protein
MADQNEQQAEYWRQRYKELQAKILRLQILQPMDVTLEELAAVNDEVPVLVLSSIIAAVCRGMLKGVGNA